MFSCFLCKNSFINITSLVRHLRQQHALYDGTTLQLKCFNDNCQKIFQTFSGYRKHIQTCILSLNEARPSINRITSDNIQFCAHNTHTCNGPQVDGCESMTGMFVSFLHSGNNKKSVQYLRDYSSNFIGNLYTLGLPNSTIQHIINSTQELLDAVINSSVDKDDISTIFTDFNSTYKRQNYFYEHIVKPVKIKIGVIYDQVWDKEKKIYVQNPVDATFTYIPILKTLEFLLKNTSFRQLLNKNNSGNINNDIISNFFDSSLYKENSFFNENPNALQLQLYFDEFEPVNPLGSKTGGHKIGAFYLIIRNIPPHFNSVLHNIHLVGLFYSSDCKKFGINSILDVIVKDIRKLESDGIYDSISNQYVKGTLVALSFDNLGGNQLYGMVESFSAKYYCRICLAEKSVAQNLTEQNNNILRNNNLYETHCAALEDGGESSVFGIKFRSFLNNLHYFKLCDNISVDIMHDLLEGVVQLEIKLFLKYIISTGQITIETVNERLKSFNFGMNESSNKPSPICLEKPGNSIGQRAAQTLCLIKYLPLILSDVIVKEERKYKVIQILLHILNIVFSPKNSVRTIRTLKFLIKRHHELYMSEYSANLTPKHHMMIHYPHVIVRMGPLTSLSSIRFEAKHGYFKHLVHSFKNFKSLTQTLALRHQECMWYHWKSINVALSPVYGKCSKVDIDNNHQFSNLLHEYFHTPESFQLTITKSVKVFGHSFQRKMFIADVNDPFTPVFCEIVEICVFEDHCYFICKPWATQRFNDLYHAYELQNDSIGNYKIIDLRKLIHFVAYEIHKPFDKNISLIVPKYSLYP